MTTASIPEIPPDKGFLPRQTKLLLGAFIVLAAIGFFAFNSLQDTQQYFLTLAELKAQGDLAYKQSVRVSGNLVPNTTQINSKEVTAQFTLTDGTLMVPVVYKGIL